MHCLENAMHGKDRVLSGGVSKGDNLFYKKV